MCRSALFGQAAAGKVESVTTNEFHLGPHRVRILHDSDSLGFAEGHFVPGVPGPPPHRHKWDEGFYVVSGRIRVVVDGDELILEPGDFAVAHGGQLHTFSVESDDPAVFAATFGQNGIAYLREMADLFTAPGPDPDKLAALHNRYGVTTD